MAKTKKYYEKYWSKLDMEQKRDLLKKYYPNPRGAWSITKQIMLDIYDKEHNQTVEQ